MDSGEPPPADADADAACSCSCLCCAVPSPSWRRSLKRKLDLILDLPEPEIVRVGIESEAVALREALASHQNSINDLYTELEEERNASASAANEAMSMILRLQHEKSEVMMESRQFRVFAEERMAHDQCEIVALEDLLFKRDQAVQALNCEIQAYRHRLASYGIGINGLVSVSEPETPESSNAGGTPRYFDYPQLRCKTGVPDEAIEKYPFGETPRQRHVQRPSVDSYGSFIIREPVGEDKGWRDDMSDRVYTIDAIHGPEDYVSSPREFKRCLSDVGADVEGVEIKKLYMRLQALEADRESMRQAIFSMGTDKAQTVLLREIAQQLCKGPAPEKKIVKKPSFIRTFSIMGIIKCIAFQCITSIIFWRKKSSEIKYTFGMTSNNAGLLLLLEKYPGTRQRRLLPRTQE